MMSLYIFPGSSTIDFTDEIYEYLETKKKSIIIKNFSCGERYVRFEKSLRGKEVFLIQTGRTQKMNDDLIELFLMIDAARQSFAEKINVVLPYYPYSRQDKIHAPREGISAKLFAKLLEESGANRIITMHLHSDQIQGFFNCPVDNLNPRRLFVEYIKKQNIKDPILIAPDTGSAKECKKTADELNIPLAILHKNRPAHNQSEVSHVIGDVSGKTAIILDDIIDGGGTVCNAKEIIIKHGANKEVYLCATHPVFSGDAIKKLSKANFKKIICTNTLPVENPPSNFETLSVTPLFAEVIKNVSEKTSVSQLYF